MTIAGNCFWEKDFCIPSRTEAGHAILDGILLQLQDYEWPQKDIFAIQLAFEEALVNAIRHGNQSENRLGVKVHLEISSQVFLARISDEGPGFDPDHLPDPTLDDFLERPCGRGVKLMRSFMTSVDFNERGNVVTMKKERSCPPPEICEERNTQMEATENLSVSVEETARSEAASEFPADGICSESDLPRDGSFSAESESVSAEVFSSAEMEQTADGGDNALSVPSQTEDKFPTETDEKSNLP